LPGAEVGRAIYDPYGGILTSTIPLTVTDRLFTGQRWDATIGLYDYNARFYDPQTGTFIQPDSIVPQPGNPIAWNRFAYVYNNPVNNVDPSGHFVVAAIDTLWDVVDLYNDARDCLGDSDSMACAMAAAGVGFILMGTLEGPSNNVARRAAKAADVGDAAGDVARRVDDVGGFTELSSQARRYLNDLETQTGFKVTKEQRVHLADTLRNQEFTKLSQDSARRHRARFNSIKDDLIAQWEQHTGQSWPRYANDITSKNGQLIVRYAGQPFDAHHIIESSYGGPNKWWNIHPARFPNQHQGGIHRSGGIIREIFP
jgi:RHS repeat-associated protein